MAIKENLTERDLRVRDNFSSCCGSNYLGSGGVGRKWKNQYGEGTIPAKDIDPVKGNYYGIALADGFQGKEGAHAKGTVNHIKTKNGKITISIREIY